MSSSSLDLQRSPSLRALGLIAVCAAGLFSAPASASTASAPLPWDRMESAAWRAGARLMRAAGVDPAHQRAVGQVAKAAAPVLRPIEVQVDAWAGAAIGWFVAAELDAVEAERLRKDGVQLVDAASGALLPTVVDAAQALSPAERAAMVREAKRALR